MLIWGVIFAGIRAATYRQKTEVVVFLISYIYKTFINYNIKQDATLTIVNVQRQKF